MSAFKCFLCISYHVSSNGVYLDAYQVKLLYDLLPTEKDKNESFGQSWICFYCNQHLINYSKYRNKVLMIQKQLKDHVKPNKKLNLVDVLVKLGRLKDLVNHEDCKVCRICLDLRLTHYEKFATANNMVKAANRLFPEIDLNLTDPKDIAICPQCKENIVKYSYYAENGRFFLNKKSKGFSNLIYGGLLGLITIQTDEELDNEKPHYECLVCPGIFYSDTALQAHFREHRKQSNFNCWQCGDECDTFILLREHYESVHGMGLFKSAGEIEQPNRKLIEQGQQTEDEDCPEETRDEPQLEIPCPHCHLNFKSFDEYLEHQCSAQEQVQQCADVQERENNGLEAPRLRSLLTGARPEKRKQQSCDCFKKNSLKAAFLEGDPSKVKKLKTGSQNARIKELLRQISHLLGAEDEKKTDSTMDLFCNGCHSTAKNRKDFYFHTNICDTIFRCNYCQFKTFESHNLELHTWDKHNIIISTCSICNFNTAIEENLDQHYLVTHGKIREEDEENQQYAEVSDFIVKSEPADVEINDIKTEEELFEESGDKESVTANASEMPKVWLPAISLSDQNQKEIQGVEVKEEPIQLDSNWDLATLTPIKDVTSKEKLPVAQASTNNVVTILPDNYTLELATQNSNKIQEADSVVISDEDDESRDMIEGGFTFNIKEVGKRAAKDVMQKGGNEAIDCDSEDDCVVIAEPARKPKKTIPSRKSLPQTVKNPPTPFELFTEQVKEQIRIQFPGRHPENYCESIIKTWRSLKEVQKWPFYVEARRLRVNFECINRSSCTEQVGTNSARKTSSTMLSNEPIVLD